jgi:hypothetical protein
MAEPEAPPSDDRRPLPEATFTNLVSMLATQALMALSGTGGDGKPDVPQARFMTDLLAVLDQKTRGNLEPDEARALESILHQVRMAILQAPSG